jgi:hypothetical protein
VDGLRFRSCAFSSLGKLKEAKVDLLSAAFTAPDDEKVRADMAALEEVMAGIDRIKGEAKTLNGQHATDESTTSNGQQTEGSEKPLGMRSSVHNPKGGSFLEQARKAAMQEARSRGDRSEVVAGGTEGGKGEAVGKSKYGGMGAGRQALLKKKMGQKAGLQRFDSGDHFAKKTEEAALQEAAQATSAATSGSVAVDLAQEKAQPPVPPTETSVEEADASTEGAASGQPAAQPTQPQPKRSLLARQVPTKPRERQAELRKKREEKQALKARLVALRQQKDVMRQSVAELEQKKRRLMQRDVSLDSMRSAMKTATAEVDANAAADAVDSAGVDASADELHEENGM